MERNVLWHRLKTNILFIRRITNGKRAFIICQYTWCHFCRKIFVPAGITFSRYTRKIFAIVGPMILYGILSSWVLGLAYWILKWWEWCEPLLFSGIMLYVLKIKSKMHQKYKMKLTLKWIVNWKNEFIWENVIIYAFISWENVVKLRARGGDFMELRNGKNEWCRERSDSGEKQTNAHKGRYGAVCESSGKNVRNIPTRRNSYFK